jgi:hypothetical protein
LSRILKEKDVMGRWGVGVPLLDLQEDLKPAVPIVSDLIKECSDLLQISNINPPLETQGQYFQYLTDLGILLSTSSWWNRYETIASTMGTECIISIKTAKNLFEKDVQAAPIKDLFRRMLCSSV